MLTLRISSPISSMHHIGSIMVAQAAIAISLDLTREKDASIEFILCTVWGEADSPHQYPSPTPSLAVDPSLIDETPDFAFTMAY